MAIYISDRGALASGIFPRTELPGADADAPMRHNFDSSILGFAASMLFHPNGEPMRPITNGRRFRPVGRYYSIKNGRAAPWESRNELRALYHAEVSPSVVSYIVQPHTLEMVISGVKRTYTPDREEVLDDGRQRIVEVKDEYKTVNDPQYAEKIAHARAVYRLSGKLFCIQERADIEAQPIFNSVELIQSFRRTAITIGDLSRVYEKFAGHTELELADVRDLFSSAALGFAKLSAMMVRRNIAIDLSQKLGPATPVYLVGRR